MRLKLELALGVDHRQGDRAPSETTWARPGARQRARDVILFIGDGMGISTIAVSVGVDGNLVMDQLPHAALSRTADADHITPDSASTMTSMMTGVNANSGVIGFGHETELGDFNGDGDARRCRAVPGSAAALPGYAAFDVADHRERRHDRGSGDAAQRHGQRL